MGAGTCSIDQSDLAELEAHLASDRVPPGTFDLSALDGFLAAIAAGPEPISPEEWLPMIWGEGPSPFTDQAEAFRIVDVIDARLRQIVQQLEEDPAAYTPIFRTTDDGAVTATAWARGFLAGVDLRPAAWAPLTRSARDIRFLAHIVAQLPDWDEKIKATSGDRDLATFRREGQRFIPLCVTEISRCWQDQRRIGQAAQRKPN